MPNIRLKRLWLGEYGIIAGRINDLAWDGESKRIIAVGNGKERFGHCITSDSGNSVGEISGHSSQINSVSIRQQRPLRAATGSDDTSVGFFHGAPFKFNTSLRDCHNKFVYGTAFSPDGSTLASVGSDRKIWLYDGQTGAPSRQIGQDAHTGSIFGVSWASDSRKFVTASADQTVKIWDTEAGKEIQSWRTGDGVSIPDQQMGVVWPHGRSDGLVISVDLGGNLIYMPAAKHSPGKYHAAERKATLWTGSADGRTRAWNLENGLCSSLDGESHSSYVSSITATSEGDRVYTAAWDDSIRTIDTTNETYLGSGRSATKAQARSIAAVTSQIALAATSSGIEVHQEGRLVANHATDSFGPQAIAFSPSSNCVVVAGDDKALHAFELSDKTTLTPKQVTSDATSSAGSALAFSPDGMNLAVGTASGGISVFATSSWSLVTSRWSAHTGRVTSLAWSKDGKHVVSSSLDTNVYVWSLANPGKRVKAGNAHKEGVNEVVWHDKVWSVGSDAAVKTWQVQDLT
ncbi:MAG: WD40 repeat-like protein [Chrysothrix sp. TS-e1954]|nr:MAG: WD40 repeat-like protein [Chrysothrix sp. TS-e1954]